MTICRDCPKRASFGLLGDRPRHCAAHKSPDEVNVVSKLCGIKGCRTHPTFGPRGTTIGVHCAAHKSPDEVNVKNKVCEMTGCRTRPSFGPLGTTIGLHCAAHKLPDEVDVNNKVCEMPGCRKQPTFGPPGTTIGLHCAAHKLPDEVDVVSRVCEMPGCRTLPSFGPRGTTIGLHCAAHKLLDEVNVKNKVCEMSGCRTLPTFGPIGTTIGLHCAAHKLLDEVDVRHKVCISCLTIRSHCGPKRAYCSRCCAYLFPHLATARRYLFKQRTITDFLSRHFTADVIDKPVGGCSRRRPDFLIDLGTHVIIVEIDENQHYDYDTLCEQTRVRELWEDLACRNIIFVRFNPDKYTDITNVKHPSAFPSESSSRDDTDDTDDTDNLDNRLELLRQVVSTYTTIIPTVSFNSFLFYDDCDETNVKIVLMT